MNNNECHSFSETIFLLLLHLVFLTEDIFFTSKIIYIPEIDLKFNIITFYFVFIKYIYMKSVTCEITM